MLFNVETRIDPTELQISMDNLDIPLTAIALYLQFEDCLPCFEKTLKLNPLQVSITENHNIQI